MGSQSSYLGARLNTGLCWWWVIGRSKVFWLFSRQNFLTIFPPISSKVSSAAVLLLVGHFLLGSLGDDDGPQLPFQPLPPTELSQQVPAANYITVEAKRLRDSVGNVPMESFASRWKFSSEYFYANSTLYLRPNFSPGPSESNRRGTWGGPQKKKLYCTWFFISCLLKKYFKITYKVS
jgi:hypothetical protein